MLQKLKARYDDRNNKCKTMADEIGQLETSLKEAHRHNEQLQVDLKAASAGKPKGLATVEIEDYQRTIDLLEQRIGSKQKSLDVLNDELEQLRSLNSKIQNDHAGVQLANSTLTQQLEKERSLRAELESQLLQARDVHASVRNEMASKFADVEEMRTELEHEKLGKHKLVLRIAELEDTVNHQSTDAANLRQTNEKTCADAERLKDQLYRVEQEFKLYKLKAQRAVKDNYAVEGAAASHDTSRATSIVALETELGELQRKYETEQNRLRQAHDAVTALKAENRILRQEQQQNAVQSKNSRLTSLSDRDSGADSELSTGSKFPANDKNRRASVIERDYDELLQQKDQQIRAVSTSHAELTSENSRLKRQIDELTSQINSLKQKLSDADRPEAQNSDCQRTNRIPSVEISVQTDGSLFQRLSPERNHQPQKLHPSNNVASRQRSLPQRQGSRRNSETSNHSMQTNGFADRRVMYNNSRNSISGDDQSSGTIDDEDDEMAADDTKSSTSTLSQSASQVVPRARSRQNTLSYSASSFEDLLLAPVTIQTSKIDYESNHANCMNELLTESQAMNRHLSTQIAFLKDEVRRLEANAERLNHVHNMEYLKNVLLKFLTHTESVAGGGAEREHLVEVLATMLKLTKQERKALLTRSPVESAAGGANVNSGGGGEWTGLFGRLTSVVGKK